MKKHVFIIACCSALAVVMAGCKKDKDSTSSAAKEVTVDAMLTDFADVIVLPKYEKLRDDAKNLELDAQAFISSSTDDNLNTLRIDWLKTRESWERTESFLFGPVATEDLDPSIDDWPLNSVDLDSIMGTANALTGTYVESLATSLKGFHAIEYLIFGNNSTKKAADFTAREKEYLSALCSELSRITAKMYTEWDASNGNYRNQLITAGKGSTIYTTQQEAVLEIANAITGIIDEVGAGKISEPFDAYDSTLEESQFSKNSFTDFRNNIIGARDAYKCTFGGQGGISLSAFVQQYNKSLDLSISQKLDAVISNLASYSVPFGKAIHTQRPNVSNTIAALEDLKTTLEDDLVPLIQLHVK